MIANMEHANARRAIAICDSLAVRVVLGPPLTPGDMLKLRELLDADTYDALLQNLYDAQSPAEFVSVFRTLSDLLNAAYPNDGDGHAERKEAAPGIYAVANGATQSQEAPDSEANRRVEARREEASAGHAEHASSLTEDDKAVCTTCGLPRVAHDEKTAHAFTASRR